MSFLRSVIVEVAVVVEHADVAGHEPAVGAERGFGRGRVRVADEQLRPAAPDLARHADLDVVAVVVDETDLDAGQRPPVGGDALVVRRVGSAAGDRRVLGRAEAARDLDADAPRIARPTAAGTAEPPSPMNGISGACRSGS